MSVVKVQNNGQMTIPSRVRHAVGVTDGDLVDVKAVGRKIIITPALVRDRSKLPTADDEYTPEQRRIVDAQLAEGLDDIAKGRVSPRFHTVNEMLASMRSGHKKAQRKKKTSIR